MDWQNLVSLTPPATDSSDRIATTAFVQQAILSSSGVVTSVGGLQGAVGLGSGIGSSQGVLAITPTFAIAPPSSTGIYNVTLQDHLRTFVGFSSSGPITATLNFTPSALAGGFLFFVLVSNDNVVLKTTAGLIVSKSFGASSNISLPSSTYQNGFYFMGSDTTNMFLNI